VVDQIQAELPAGFSLEVADTALGDLLATARSWATQTQQKVETNG
jgi:hypothetical protein